MYPSPVESGSKRVRKREAETAFERLAGRVTLMVPSSGIQPCKFNMGSVLQYSSSLDGIMVVEVEVEVRGMVVVIF